ncbi:MAG: CpaF family protein [Azospirillaceae bacterium]|nr:CpaF family protein [Azospirillaceae bacterium]
MFGRKALDRNNGAMPDEPVQGDRPAPLNVSPLIAAALTAAPRPEPIVAPPGDAAAGAPVRLDEGVVNLMRSHVFERINVAAAATSSRARLIEEISAIVGQIASVERLPINAAEQAAITKSLLDDMLGVGPIEPLLEDESITDIMVNGPFQIYVERRGKLELTDAKFRDAQHVTSVAQRIAASIGRRVDESSPTCDARLADGSRVNIVLPPVAIDGACISIRKFAKRKIDLSQMARQGNLSMAMAKLLEVASACRLNIVISGGTGSGKTTLLNALSRLIDSRERVITIEDAAELQLQQPHVVRMETRPINTEGHGEINQRELVRNALRMRPDRIILGETRGAEAFDVLQAMNTGHDGSMTTVHANTPRDALSRLENMVLMSNANLPLRAIRSQIASAVNLVIQIERMRDGVRRIQNITEVVGMEGEVVTTQDLFTFEINTREFQEQVFGDYVANSVRPHFSRRAAYYGLEGVLAAAMK